MEQLPLGVFLRERATFEAFVIGHNLELVSRLRDAAARPARFAGWLWGGAGCGRSHLLQAVCAAAPPGEGVAYLPLRELGAAAGEFLGRAPGPAVLCLDDVDAVVGDPAIERALFAAFQRLDERGGRIIAAAGCAPHGLAWRLADIASRFAASEIFQVRALDESGQQEALRRRAAERGFELPEETMRYLLRRFPRDMTTLGRLLDEIDTAGLRAQRRLTVPFVRGILGDP